MNKKCEVCGEKATVFVRDVEEVESIIGWLEIKPYGHIHSFCADHNRESRTMTLSGYKNKAYHEITH